MDSVVEPIPGVLDFSSDLKAKIFIPENARLILWAGDTIHGITDVERLPNYDFYLCAGFMANLQANAATLPAGKYICLVNINVPEQLKRFVDAFAGRLAVIDSDYNGNTPTLPLSVYASLLAPGGKAYHIDGINCITMPEMEMLNLIDIFAPVLPPEILVRHRWCREIIELARDNRLSPHDTWTSSDLAAPYYADVVRAQKTFEMWEKRRNPRWPYYANDLETHWASLPTSVLTSTVTPYRNGLHADFVNTLIDTVEPYKERFARWLDAKNMESLYVVTADYENKPKDIKFLQSVLKDVSRDLGGLLGSIQNYVDERRGTLSYGLVVSTPE